MADAPVLHVSTEAPEMLNEEAARSAEWSEYGGACLEAYLRVDPALGHSPIRLLDARYFVRAAGYTPYESPYAAHSDAVGKECWSLNAPGCRPEPIKRRQALPADAFISLRQLQEMQHIRSKYGNSLRIIVISHPWLQPDHCDPFAHNYSIIAQAVVLYLEEYGGNFGIFLDFMSLHQKDEQGRRTADEQWLFSRALDSLPELYSHLHTVVFKVTSLPTGYPGGYVFSSGTQPNQARYADRGWCFFEASVANFKDFRFVIDLGSLKPDAPEFPSEAHQFHPFRIACALNSGRQAPLVPREFARALRRKTFTSKKADCAVVVRLYATAFASRLGEATDLVFQGLGWDDAQAARFAQVIASGVLVRARVISLNKNEIGSIGMQKLGAAITHRALPVIEHFIVDDNPGDPTPVLRALTRATGPRVNP